METGLTTVNAQGTMAPMAGIVQTSNPAGGSDNAVLMDTGLVQANMNNIVQFTITNTASGNAAQKLRIGSYASRPDAYSMFGLDAGAADNGVIVDQFGAGCLAVQGFSRIVSSKPVIVTRIKIIMAAADAQLNQPIRYRSLQLDGTVDEIKQNVAWTQERSDQRANMIEKKGLWILDSQQFIEYTILAAKVVDIFLEVTGFSSTVAFKPLLPR